MSVPPADAPPVSASPSTGASTASTSESPGQRWLGVLLLILAIAFGSWARIDTALRDPAFDRESPIGMLRSDPALLYYFTERIVESGGWLPDDLRADPRVRYPEATDLAATFTLGQEFVVAWSYLAADALWDDPPPLHVVSLWVMALCASLGALGVFGLARELTGRSLLAGMGAVLFATLLVNYRTIGLVLIREDFSFPWLLAHLWLAARAVRVRSRASIVLAAATLAVALATWHATVFFFSLEAACVLILFLRTGRNVLGHPGGWLFTITLLAFGLLIPVLRTNVVALSPPMLLAWGLTAAGLARTRWPSRAGQTTIALTTMLVGLGAGLGISRASGHGLAESSHVFGLVVAKLRHLGQLPPDPLALSAEVRLMWQGPFRTLDLASWSEGALVAATLAAAGLVIWSARVLYRPAGTGLEARRDLLVLLVTLSFPVAWLIERTLILPGALLPVAAACLAARPGRRKASRGPLLLAAACVLMGLLIRASLSSHRITWYRPLERQTELARLIEALPPLVPEGEAVAADFVNSTAILAHTGRPILLQPKYEDRLSRERAERFFDALFRGTTEDVERLLEQHSCRFLLIDRLTLWYAGRYAAGMATSVTTPPPGTALAVLMSEDPATLESVPGLRLLYRSPPEIRWSDGSSTDAYRLFERIPPR